MERIRSIISFSTVFSPTEVEITTGKKAMRKLMRTFGKTPIPNQTTNRGVMAILGMVWEVTKMGISVRSRVLDQTMRIPAGTPRPALARKPRITSPPVIHVWLKR
jgi:hypothetical protein